jgi:hypothetical protein
VHAKLRIATRFIAPGDDNGLCWRTNRALRLWSLRRPGRRHLQQDMFAQTQTHYASCHPNLSVSVNLLIVPASRS